jgi:hypothetical protein
VNTQEARGAYRDHIAGFYKSGTNYGRPYLRSGWKWSRVRFLAGGPYDYRGYVDLKCHPSAYDGFRAVAAVFHSFGYSFDSTAGGTVAMRNITGAASWRIAKQVATQYPWATSIHAHGCALDINPDRNPYGSSRPDEFDSRPDIIAALKAIKTVDGVSIVRWGGDWSVDDDMHFEVTNCTRVQLERGIDWDTVRGWDNYLAWTQGGGYVPTPDGEEEEMAFLPIQYGDGYPDAPADAKVAGNREFKIEDVRALQDMLNFLGAGLTLDGLYGPATIAAVEKYTGTWTGHPDGRVGKWFGGNQWGNLVRAVGGGGGGSTVDQVARDAAAAAQAKATTADKTASDAKVLATQAKSGADRANATLDKIRAE